jgi:nicotinamidase-related amidase
MSIIRSDRPALLLVDLQKGFELEGYWGIERNNPDAEIRASELLKLWRENSLPIFHIRHCSTIPTSPLHPSHSGNEFQEQTSPREGEPVINKNVNSAFIGTGLQAQLDKAGITKLVIAGLTTDHCISTTTRMAGNLGYETYLVADATATFDKTGLAGQHYPAELIHDTALASLSEEFASIVTTGFIKNIYQTKPSNFSTV